jgi:hypothetical protein
MPVKNNFQHATYSRIDPSERASYRDFVAGAPAESAAWLDAMGHLGERLVHAGVKVILFLHGSPLTSDLFGAQRLDEGVLKRGYSRGIPGIETLLASMREAASRLPAFPDGKRPPFADDEETRNHLDQQVHDAANFSGSYVDLFRQGISRHGAASVACYRSLWSSEHHHLGRTLAAWRLAEQLRTIALEAKAGTGDRLVVIAHGHAGQVVALLSNLLTPGLSASRITMGGILASYIQAHSTRQEIDFPAMEHLIEAGSILNGTILDVVTLGTSVRFGWEASTIGKLLHIVNHRPLRSDGKRWLAKAELPQITVELPYAMGGDYVQQLAIAGTDALPGSAAAQAANKALWEMLEPYDGFEKWLECARKGVRCPNDGRCLLVDYKDADTTPEPTPSRHVYGHAAYTRLDAMLFNTTEIVGALYSS